MPLYLFRCVTCKTTIEVLQSYIAPPPLCPICTSAMERTFAPSLITSVDSPEVHSYRQDGMRITTVDRRRRRERLE
jgi:putative FmdB family regulatory protein